MEILKVLALQGPNVWGSSSILECWIDASAQRDLSGDALRAVAGRLVELAKPYLAETDFQLSDTDVRRPTLALGCWIERIVRELQLLSTVETPIGRVVENQQRPICCVAVHFEDEGLVRPALKIACDLIEAALRQQPYDFAIHLRTLQAVANDICFGPSTRAIVEAARIRGIPVRRLNVESLVQFGQGAEQRRICTAETDGTGIIAETIAQDKELTKALLRRVGIPVPDGRPVTSAEDAWTAACEIGVPVVVKPRDANHGRGVAVKLTLRDRIMLAYEHAFDEGSEVIVEQYVPGNEHRILVVGNRVVAVSRGEPDVVVGDGVKSVRELVELANLDPRRGDEYARPMCKLKLDPIALLLLEHQDYVPESIPATGDTVIIHRNGEFTTDVTDQLHPEVAARAVLAARTVGLDVAGIDVVLQDIGLPLEEQGGMVIEVNAGPGLQMHAQPQIGRSRPVGAAIIDELFPHGQTGRIPVVAISDGPGALKATRVTSHLLRQSGLCVGMASREGTFVGDRRLIANGGIQPYAADLFLNPLVEAAVLLTTPEVVYQEGLSFDDCDVVVIESTPVQSESCEGLHEPDSWRRILVESVTPLGTAVIDADDPYATRLASYCQGDVLFCHPGEQHPLLVQHRTAGHNVIFLRDRTIWVAHGEKEFAIATAKATVTVDAPMLAGIAAAWATGTPPDILAKALELLGDPEHVTSLPADPLGAPTDAHPDQPRAA